MENIASPTPGIDSIAHWPGLCSNAFLPSGVTTRKVLTSGVSMRISVTTPIDGDQRIFQFSHCAFSSQRFHHLDDVHLRSGIWRRSGRSPRSRTCPSLFVGIVHQLVHKPLAEPLQLRQARLPGGHFGEVGIHARVPAAEALHAVAGVEVLDVVALAGGADEGAGAAAEAGFRTALPTAGSLKNASVLPAAERVRTTGLPAAAAAMPCADLRLLRGLRLHRPPVRSAMRRESSSAAPFVGFRVQIQRVVGFPAGDVAGRRRPASMPNVPQKQVSAGRVQAMETITPCSRRFW